MIDINDKKPRLAETGQGFSVLKTVEYKGKFLYSKYSPDKAILKTVEQLVILPGTIILINSPVLWYGLNELLNKTPENCCIIALEADVELYEFSLSYLPEQFINKIQFIKTENLENLDSLFRNKINSGKFKRLLSVDFSAGVNFNKNTYDLIKNGLQEIIERFWKNRITLTKLGKLYSKNLIQNLKITSSAPQLYQMKNSVNKPILVCGAGESLDNLFPVNNKGICPYSDLINDRFFIICADACLIPLQKRGIKASAVVLLEAQFAITKAFLGNQSSDTILFMDISARHDIKKFYKNRTVLFATEYADSSFLKKLKDTRIIKEFSQGLGSVGLAAVEIAKLLRKDNSIPIFICGMDFSYSLGRTHCMGTFHDIARFLNNKKTKGTDNIAPSFSVNTHKFTGKNNKTFYTTPVMEAYSSILTRLNSNETNIYDAGISGINLNLPIVKTEKLLEFSKNITADKNKILLPEPLVTEEAILNLINNELSELNKLKDLLINGTASKKYDSSISLNEQIKNILKERDYLYIHFPDGHTCTTEESFLKRIRAEIDSFIKLFTIAI